MRKVKYNKAYIAVKNLEVNDYMLDINNHPVQIFKIEYIPGDCEVYNLSVNTNYNYYANDILVHNKGFFGCGSDYEGSDDLGAARSSDALAWKGTKSSMEAIDRQARQYITDQNALYRATNASFRDKTTQLMKSHQNNASAQALNAEDMAAQTGFVHSGSVEQANEVNSEEGKNALQSMFTDQDITTKQMQSDTNTFLQGLAQKQADLYASFTASQVGDQDVTFEQSFSGYDLGSSGGWQDATTSGIGKSKACFIGGTLVEGKAIEQLQEGDILSSYNIKKNIKERSKVIKLYKHIVDTGYYIINDHLKVTGEHPVFVVGG